MPLSRRIRPPLRPLRPPLPHKCTVRPRFFARNAQLLLVSPAIPRPQLGFLGPSSRRGNSHTGQWQLSRLITTETKIFLKAQAWQGSKWTFYGGIFTVLGIAWGFLFTHELAEHEYPTPPEWTHITRFAYHSAKCLEEPVINRFGVVEWGIVGRAYKKLLTRLEDPETDGNGLLEQEEGGILVPGMGQTGLDISTKSEAWRRGYHETLMGCAKAAEHLDGQVRDVRRRHIFPPEYVIGPSNPNPKPTPPWRPSAPLEEDCEPAYAPPETYYLKILTTKGFTTKQRLDAALAYAEWLNFKGMHDTAEEMLRWGLDIATSVLPSASAVVDMQTGTIKAEAPIVTENILAAITMMAVHRGQIGDTTKALPIFLSVLRARRAAPIDTSIPTKSQPTPKSEAPQTDIGAFMSIFKSFYSILQAVKYPPPPPSGDESLLRTPGESCQEAALMAYIGEILFASSKAQHDQGLAWTKDAVQLAEEGVKDFRVPKEAKMKCVECLGVGVNNWRIMVDRIKEEGDGAANIGEKNKSWTSWIRTKSPTQTSISLAKKWEQAQEDLEEVEGRLRRGRLLESQEREEKPFWATWLIYVF